PLPPRSLREDIADRAACGSECGLHSAVAALVMAPIAHILGSVSVKRIPGGALASTGVAKSPGACRGGSFPRKSSGKLIVANDDNYALAAEGVSPEPTWAHARGCRVMIMGTSRCGCLSCDVDPTGWFPGALRTLCCRGTRSNSVLSM